MRELCMEPDCDREAMGPCGLCNRCWCRARGRERFGWTPRENGRNQRREGACCEEGCEEPVFSRGRCKRHYEQDYRRNRGARQGTRRETRGRPVTLTGLPEPQECCIAAPAVRGLCKRCCNRWYDRTQRKPRGGNG